MTDSAMAQITHTSGLPAPDRPAEAGTTLPANLIAFGRALRERKVDVTAGRLIDVAHSLRLIDLTDRDQFYHALRANLVSSPRDLATFDELFAAFWASGLLPGDPLWTSRAEAGEDGQIEPPRAIGLPQLQQLGLDDWETGAQEEASEEQAIPGYSAQEVLAVKDFATFTTDEVQEIGRVVTLLGRKLATRLSRRTLPTKRRRGQVDLRRSLRANLRYGGDAVRLLRRLPKPGKTKIVVLCDVSGSMDLYSRFLVQFLYALQNRLSNVETFVFGTRLTRVTPLLRHRSLRQALFRIGQIALDWSGGTNIGFSLQQFTQTYGSTALGPRTVVVLMSDGWDRGDVRILEREMQRLRLNSKKILWLNPLLGSPNYQPLCKGISVSLPYVDYFLPVHNVASLAQVGQTLVALAR